MTTERAEKETSFTKKSRVKVFIRCEICRRTCRHRREANKATGDMADGCVVSEDDFNRYANGMEKKCKRTVREM